MKREQVGAVLLRQIDRWIGRHMGPVRWVVAWLLVSGIGVRRLK